MSGKYLLGFFLLLVSVSCQRKSAEQIAYKRYKDSIQKELLRTRLDTADFKRKTGSKGRAYSYYTYTDTNNETVKIEDFVDRYLETRTYPNSPYAQTIQYNTDGSLKRKFRTYKDFITGEFYEIDSLGKLQITDYEEIYKYNVDSITNFVYNLGYDDINSENLYIFRHEFRGIHYYSIHIYDSLRRRIFLDAETGYIYKDVAHDALKYIPEYHTDEDYVDFFDEEKHLRYMLLEIAAERNDTHEELKN